MCTCTYHDDAYNSTNPAIPCAQTSPLSACSFQKKPMLLPNRKGVPLSHLPFLQLWTDELVVGHSVFAALLPAFKLPELKHAHGLGPLFCQSTWEKKILAAHSIFTLSSGLRWLYHRSRKMSMCAAHSIFTLSSGPRWLTRTKSVEANISHPPPSTVSTLCEDVNLRRKSHHNPKF